MRRHADVLAVLGLLSACMSHVPVTLRNHAPRAAPRHGLAGNAPLARRVASDLKFAPARLSLTLRGGLDQDVLADDELQRAMSALDTGSRAAAPGPQGAPAGPEGRDPGPSPHGAEEGGGGDAGAVAGVEEAASKGDTYEADEHAAEPQEAQTDAPAAAPDGPQATEEPKETSDVPAKETGEAQEHAGSGDVLGEEASEGHDRNRTEPVVLGFVISSESSSLSSESSSSSDEANEASDVATAREQGVTHLGGSDSELLWGHGNNVYGGANATVGQLLASGLTFGARKVGKTLRKVSDRASGAVQGVVDTARTKAERVMTEPDKYYFWGLGSHKLSDKSLVERAFRNMQMLLRENIPPHLVEPGKVTHYVYEQAENVKILASYAEKVCTGHGGLVDELVGDVRIILESVEQHLRCLFKPWSVRLSFRIMTPPCGMQQQHEAALLALSRRLSDIAPCMKDAILLEAAPVKALELIDNTEVSRLWDQCVSSGVRTLGPKHVECLIDALIEPHRADERYRWNHIRRICCKIMLDAVGEDISQLALHAMFPPNHKWMLCMEGLVYEAYVVGSLEGIENVTYTDTAETGEIFAMLDRRVKAAKEMRVREIERALYGDEQYQREEECDEEMETQMNENRRLETIKRKYIRRIMEARIRRLKDMMNHDENATLADDERGRGEEPQVQQWAHKTRSRSSGGRLRNRHRHNRSWSEFDVQGNKFQVTPRDWLRPRPKPILKAENYTRFVKLFLRNRALAGDGSACVHAVIQCGAQIDEADDEGYTPLHLAASKGNIHAVRALGAMNANLVKKTKMGMNATMLAREGGHDEAAEIIEQLARTHEGSDIPGEEEKERQMASFRRIFGMAQTSAEDLLPDIRALP